LRLGDRDWKCPACSQHHGRDHNAAKMILKQGQVQLRVERPKVKPADSGTIRLNCQSAEVEAGSRHPLGHR
jgi:transposase